MNTRSLLLQKSTPDFSRLHHLADLASAVSPVDIKVTSKVHNTRSKRKCIEIQSSRKKKRTSSHSSDNRCDNPMVFAKRNITTGKKFLSNEEKIKAKKCFERAIKHLYKCPEGSESIALRKEAMDLFFQAAAYAS